MDEWIKQAILSDGIKTFLQRVIEYITIKDNQRWGCTFYKRFLRINVGRIELLTIDISGNMRLILVHSIIQRNLLIRKDIEVNYKGEIGVYPSLPDSCIFSFSSNLLNEIADDIYYGIKKTVDLAIQKPLNPAVKRNNNFQLLSVLDINNVILPAKGDGSIEGRAYTYEMTAYERDPSNRAKCIEFFGYNCQICGFNFERKYGEVGEKYIQVHHIEPLSESKKSVFVNPIEDLIPVCANCHCMLHSKKPALKPDELIGFIRA